jgi:hypothetical protein
MRLVRLLRKLSNGRSNMDVEGMRDERDEEQRVKMAGHRIN